MTDTNGIVLIPYILKNRTAYMWKLHANRRTAVLFD